MGDGENGTATPARGPGIGSCAAGTADCAGAGTCQMNLNAVDGKTGMKKWSYPANVSGGAAAIGADGTVYISSDPFTVHAIDPNTGMKKWSDGANGQLKWS